MADYSRSEFATALLSELGVPTTQQNLDFMQAWMAREGTKAAYNPLATTLAYGGASGFNSVGVKNYGDFETGVKATAQTLLHSGYDDILEGLRSGQGAWNASHGLSRWSGGGYSSLKLSNNDGAAAVASGASLAAGGSVADTTKLDSLGARLASITDFLGGTPAKNPAMTPTQSEAITASAAATTGPTAVGQAAIDAAMTALGKPYVWGGNDLKAGVDCSGLIQQAYKAAGIDIPRISNEQANAGQQISFDQAQPGDILWWDYGPGSQVQGADHVAMYLGNGKMIEALHKGAPVHIVDVRRPDGVTRITGSATTTASATQAVQTEVTPDMSLAARLAAISSALSGTTNPGVLVG